MDDEERLVAQIIGLAGGELVGRIRLQKAFYLLEKMGLVDEFSYSYHHYGPYSAELADAVDGAKAFGFVSEETRHRKSDGVPFSVFKFGRVPAGELDVLDEKRQATASRALRAMNARSATVLELAATICWLRDELELEDWSEELVRRKGPKTEGGRTGEALQLLEELAI